MKPELICRIAAAALLALLLPGATAMGFTLERGPQSVVIWGNGTAGQKLVPEGLKAHGIAVGETSICAIGPEGTLSCWGCGDTYADWGQCDTITYGTCESSPELCDDTVLGFRRYIDGPAAAISASRAHGCQLVSGGVVQCWGCRPDEYQGQCAAPRELRTGNPDNLEVAEGYLLTGWYHSCLLDSSGTPRCFGCEDDDINKGQCTPPEGLTGQVALAGEGATSCALDAAGMITCWGDDSFGHMNIPADLRASDLAVSPFHACAIDAADGTISCWGCAGAHRGETVDHGQCAVPEGMKGSRIEVGHTASCAITADGTVTCWGCNGKDEGPCKLPDFLAGESITDIAMNGQTVAALLTPGAAVEETISRRRDQDARIHAAQQKLVSQLRGAALAKVADRSRQAQAEAAAKADFTNHLGMHFATIPAGKSWIGACPLNREAEQRLRASGKAPWEVEVTSADGQDCPPGMLPDPMAWENEYPAHQRDFAKAFQMGMFEVTLGQYREFLAMTGTTPHAFFDKANAGNPADHPVVWVNLDEAKSFAAWLNLSKPETDKGHYRLPGEGEWEYAARGPNGITRFSWGHEMGKDNTNCAPGFCGESIYDTAPVGSFPATGFDLYDMLGNVDEWVADCMTSDHTTSPRDAGIATDPDCGFYIARGGSWKYPIGEMRVSYRDFYPREGRTKEQGFRILREMPE